MENGDINSALGKMKDASKLVASDIAEATRLHKNTVYFAFQGRNSLDIKTFNAMANSMGYVVTLVPKQPEALPIELPFDNDVYEATTKINDERLKVAAANKQARLERKAAKE